MRTSDMHDVAMVISDMGNGGTQRVYATIANAWAEQGRRICIITQSSPENDFQHIDNRVTRISCNGLGASGSVFESIWNNIVRIYKLRKAISGSGAPVTIASVTPMAVLSIIATIGISTRLVVSERNDPARQSYGKVWDFLRRILYPRAELVTANSYGALASMEHFVARNRLGYLPNPLPSEIAQESKMSRTPVILNVGRMYKQKAQGILIEAFANVAKANPDWRLSIAGTGPMSEDLEALSRKLGVGDRINWLGAVPDLSDHYARASIFALPSHYEGMPNALMEAMRWRLPCIVSDASPGPLEIIEDQKNGLVFPVDDLAALTKVLSLLMKDKEIRADLGEAAYDKSHDFDIGNVLDVWEKVLGIPDIHETA